MKRFSFILAIILVNLIACTSEKSSDTNTSIIAAPMLEATPGEDRPDFDCKIILTNVSRQSNGTGGYIDDGHNWIWAGQIRVLNSAVSEGWVPRIAYMPPSQDAWRAAETTLVTQGAVFSTYSFTMSENLPGPGMSGTSITRSVIQLIPLLERNGERMFDHNRIPGIFDNYRLTIDNGFQIVDDPAVCVDNGQPDEFEIIPPEFTVDFTADGNVNASGVLIGNGILNINYDINRLPNCRGTHNGYPAWDLIAYAKFLPSNTIAETSVRVFETNYGYPTNVAHAIPAEFAVPEGTTSVEIWFANSTLGGSSCIEWDSNNGNNYKFNVSSTPGWTGNNIVKISRGDSSACNNGTPWSGSTIYFGSWERTRAVVGNFCLEVWQEGVTDFNNPQLWQQIDARVYYRFEGEDFRSKYIDFVDYTGNNARYAFNLASIDPLGIYRCPDFETRVETLPSGEQQEQAMMEFFFSFNGQIHTTGNDGNPYFVVNYTDYYPNQFRESNCNQ
ncbi:hypothetical protein KKF34_12175 [Myxococcota bacterium]|nr:hypothetical protein [Myxococcota bacterium]MBU1379418.1 hypothetical protein [Myxococcota bacterium]MBU1497621.1 hypothetical protein [Myxococcota bacterium]